MESAAVVGMAGQGGDEIGVGHLLIEEADEGASGEVRAGDFVDGVLLFLLRCRIEDGDHTGDTAQRQHLLDGVVVFLGRDEWK